ncbi:MAG: fibronectin type III domain-containing protein, partial [Paludibacteraceae bacterium]|nr:fibronectin type III domain-containing protein [Paludibacteraceae bacterium]
FIRFHSDVIVGNQFKDIVIYKKQIINNTQNTQALTSTPAGTSITVNSALSIVYANPASNIAISATSNNGTVSVSPTSISSCTSGTANVSITYTPASVGDAKITLKLTGGASGTYTFTGTGTLEAPTNLTVSNISYSSARLRWDAVSGAEKYILYIDNKEFASTKDNSTYIDINEMSLGTKYSNIVVKAFANGTESNPSNEVEFTTLDLQAPQTVVADQENTSYSSVPLSWSVVKDATGYLIVNNVNGSVTVVDGGTTSEYTVAGLEMNTNYTFKVYPLYNGLRSQNYKTSNSVKTKSMNVELSNCMIYESTDEYNFEMSAGEFYMPNDNGHVVADPRKAYTKWVTFDIKKWLGYVGSVYDVRMFVKVGNKWQSQYIWNANQEDRLNFNESDYITCTVEIPFNVTAIRFQGSALSAWWGDWMKYGGNMRYIKNVRVYMGSYAKASVPQINYDVYIGQNDEDNIKTFNLTYANRVTDDAKFNIDNNKFSGTFPTIVSCTAGVENNIPVKFYTEELGDEQGGLTIVTGDVASVSLVANVKALPAPKNLKASVTGKSNATLTWSEDLGNNNKASGLASGYYVRVKKGDADYGEPVFVSRNTSGTGYTYQLTDLDEASEYSFKVTTIYTDSNNKKIENEYAEVSATTYTSDMAVSITGIFGSKGIVTVSSTAWNPDEKSYAIGSTATVAVNSLPTDCVVESIVANGEDISATAQFEVIAENSVVVTYRYAGTGVAEVIDSHGNVIYGTLTDAVDQADDGADINLLGDVAQDLTVDKHIFFNGNGFKINNLYIKKTGNVELTGDVNVVMDFGLEVTPDKAGQYDGHSKSLTILGDAYIDVQFDEVKRDKWYAFSVPFSVKMDAVKNAENLGAAMVYGKDYLFLGFDGEARSKGEQGWITYNTPEILEPGQLYMIGTEGSIVHRFYKIKESALVSNVVSFDLESHVSAKSSNLSDWNALGNSQLFNVDADQNGTQFDDDVIAQVYQSASDSYLPVVLKEHVMGVTNPIFVQKTAKCSNVSINKAGGLRSAVIESALYNIQIKKEGAEKFDDQMFVSASDNAPSTYIAGYALMKLGLSGSIAQIYSNMYNTNLCMVNAPYAEDGAANIPLRVYAPAAGNYTLSLGKEVNDGTTLMLVKDGAEIHNFNTDGAYTLYLAKGNNSSYSLRIVGENGEILTPVVDDEAENVKVYVKEGVLVIEGLASGEHYMVGNVVRALYRGTSNGGDVRIALPERGVYWVNAGSAKVKVLNK